ncbi:hypothetical protein LR948_14015 [Roseivivax sp. GX 12232]|uniref:hypothetical protein n=1 Tax=Roseivivax sp. GX 12232 TaxID=2900547 RepID=UPI001E4DCE2B|nr:hypothetical protein [Roseivivax sp. GX 12232]MCE0506483.1 hypothetical protein [Roseivivax sp. GX 12232]
MHHISKVALTILSIALIDIEAAFGQEERCSFESSLTTRPYESEWSFILSSETPLSELSDQIGCDVLLKDDPIVTHPDGRNIGKLVGLLTDWSEAGVERPAQNSPPYWVVESSETDTVYLVPPGVLSIRNTNENWSASIRNLETNAIAYVGSEVFIAPTEELRLDRDSHLAVFALMGMGSSKMQVTFESEPDGASIYIKKKFEQVTNFRAIMDRFDIMDVTLKLDGFEDCDGNALIVNNELPGYLSVACNFEELNKSKFQSE